MFGVQNLIRCYPFALRLSVSPNGDTWSGGDNAPPSTAAAETVRSGAPTSLPFPVEGRATRARGGKKYHAEPRRMMKNWNRFFWRALLRQRRLVVSPHPGGDNAPPSKGPNRPGSQGNCSVEILLHSSSCLRERLFCHRRPLLAHLPFGRANLPW